MTKVIVIGQGYVGLPVAVRAAEAGFDVVGYDLDEAKVKRLANGDSFVEDISEARLRGVLDSGRYRPSADDADLVGFDVAVISVPTPLSEGVPDLSHISPPQPRSARMCAPAAPSFWSPQPIPAPRRSWWARSWPTCQG